MVVIDIASTFTNSVFQNFNQSIRNRKFPDQSQKQKLTTFPKEDTTMINLTIDQ